MLLDDVFPGGIPIPWENVIQSRYIVFLNLHTNMDLTTPKLFGLLLELNRRMPNGTYGGVRGATC